LQHAHSSDPARRKHRLGPVGRLGTEHADLGQQPRCASFNAIDLLGRQVLSERAKAPRFVPQMQGDLLETLVKRLNDAIFNEFSDFFQNPGPSCLPISM
jgi:hypothetical protein